MTNEKWKIQTQVNGSKLVNSANNEIAVRVLFFGAARDAVGKGEVDFTLHGAPTASTAFASVLERFPELERFGRSLLFAVNQEYAQADREVHDGDELAVFPPVSGGAGSAGSLPASTSLHDFFE